jgi:hypothetical protein
MARLLHILEDEDDDLVSRKQGNIVKLKLAFADLLRYARFSELRTQILALSRENTNVRSLAISLDQKRKAMWMCQDALHALQQEIAGEPTPRSSQSAQHESRAADRPLTVPRRLVDGSSAGCYSAFSRPRRGLDGATGFGLDGLPPGAGEACVWLGGGDEAAAGARERTGPVCAGGDAAGAEPPCMLPT